MSGSLIFLFIAITLVGGLIYGVRQYRRFRFIENMHRNLAEKTGLHPAYLNERSFNIFGSYRGYPLKITPFMIVKQSLAVRFTIPMINPNLKWFSASKNLEAIPGFDQVTFHDKASDISQDIDPQIKIRSNDMIFSSLILSDNVKISIFEAFKDIPSGLLVIEDKEMYFILPGKIDNDVKISQSEKIINLMCDMKDELN
ncbi:MAG: hypothetical protein KDD63_02855, partial [Bacteroidetes bacterium]|nr:hypothetical protein [Bacteroidota bacterium]MCB0844839.1 hypothetical protein [Bacteroidota bacterium]MCB0851158.1 hypothetical protein [Bacteroidota bacterium]